MILAQQRLPSGTQGWEIYWDAPNSSVDLYRLQVFLSRATIFIGVHTRICTESGNKQSK